MSYQEEVWEIGVSMAESEVMRATATPPGGRKKDESLSQYVTRTRQIQDVAMQRYQIACEELAKVKP
jgi:hypothetical protein